MSHEITSNDAVILKGQGAWHGLGTIIQDDMSAIDAYRKFWKIDPVERWPLATVNPAVANDLAEGIAALERGDVDDARLLLNAYSEALQHVPSHVANVRPSGDQADLMGVVGSSYQICSDQALAEFTDALSDTGKVTVETCGTLSGGRKVWFLAKGEEFEIGQGDSVMPYLCVSNAHDGTNAIRVTPTSVRVVCANTLGFCIGATGDSIGNSALSIRHSGDVADKLEQAKLAIRQYEKGLADTKQRFEQLRGTPVNRQQAMALFAGQYASYWEVADNEDLASKDSAVRKLAERRMVRMESASRDFMTRFEEESNRFGGSNMWIAMNAFTGYVQHDKPAEKTEAQRERKIDSNLFGLNADRSFETLQKALEMASALSA